MAKRALCVGINQFAHLPMASWLNGCVNDANDMAAMLRRRGADEAFACHDMAQKGDQWDTDTVIIDDELRLLFGKLPKGVVMEAYLDTCHSGTGLKAEDLLSGRRPRFVPPPTMKGLRSIDAAATKSTTAELVKSIPAGGRPVLFGGCPSDQTSADATFDGRSSGAFTYFFLKALAANPTGSRADLHKALTKGLVDADFSQRPTLEGPPKAKKTGVGQPW